MPTTKTQQMKKQNTTKTEKARLIAILLISLFVILTGSLFTIQLIKNGEIAGGVLGIIIAVIIFTFALIIFKKGNQDLKKGFPIQDERSKRVMEKASSLAFYVSLYMLLGIGLLSENTIPFKDISQATNISVGLMALLFLIFWIYYNQKEI